MRVSAACISMTWEIAHGRCERQSCPRPATARRRRISRELPISQHMLAARATRESSPREIGSQGDGGLASNVEESTLPEFQSLFKIHRAIACKSLVLFLADVLRRSSMPLCRAVNSKLEERAMNGNRHVFRVRLIALFTAVALSFSTK